MWKIKVPYGLLMDLGKLFTNKSLFFVPKKKKILVTRE